MIVPLCRTERLRRVATALAILPPRAGGPLSAVISIIGSRPHTLTPSLRANR